MGLMMTPGGRLFDTSTARFLSRDPVRAPGQNPYLALNNNPINMVDPRGAAPVPATWSIDPVAGTATARAGATLWDLAEALTGSGANWRQLGYPGDPRTMGIGTRIDISRFLFPLFEDIRRYQGAMRNVRRALKNVGRFCCPEEAEKIVGELLDWFIAGNTFVGAGAGFVALPKHPRIAAWFGKLGTLAGGVGVAFDVYAALSSAARHDVGGTIQGAAGFSVGIAAFVNPWWGALAGVGALGQLAIKGSMRSAMNELTTQYNKMHCYDWQRILKRAKQNVEGSESAALIARQRLSKLGVSVPRRRPRTAQELGVSTDPALRQRLREQWEREHYRP